MIKLGFALLALLLVVVARELRLAAKAKAPMGRLRRVSGRMELRGAARYKVDWALTYRLRPTGSSKRGTLRNLSPTGASIVLQEKFRAGATIFMEFEVPDRQAPVHVTGEVMWLREDHPEIKRLGGVRFYLVGVRFSGADPETVSLLTRAFTKEGTCSG